ncbi:MAG: methyltransferase domain-containing protein [Chloroflexi bacterium]|nr:methyltransferase domain-containing protein [Chloroflexota bacterium]
MPPEFRHILWNIRGFQPAYTFQRFLQGKRRILILGETSGRDSHFFSSLGRDVYAVDIVVGPYKVDRLTIADITKPLPFPAKHFDAIIMSEILEHVIDDVVALKEAQRVLSDDGLLAVSVPFCSDWPGIHLRLHSASTIRALLEYSGFTIEEMFESSTWIQTWHYAIQLLCTIVFHTARTLNLVRDRDEVYLPILTFIANKDFANIGWRRQSRYHGAHIYIKARKGLPANFLNLQVQWFSKVSTR